MTQRPYHHGDLRSELIRTGIGLMRAGGPSALTAREATREVGVSVTALYRHFDSVEQWRAEVFSAAREALARSIQRAMDVETSSTSRASIARHRFRACGEGYVQFAIDDPLLFSGAFATCSASPLEPDEPSPAAALEGALDDLVDADLLSPSLRTEAPIIAWTAVHGLAALIAQGALDVRDVKDPRIQVVLDAVARALSI